MKWIITRLQRNGTAFPHLDLQSIKKPKIFKQETNYLTEPEVGRFLRCIALDIERRPMVRNLRFMALAVFLLQTGARIGEALSINITDIDRQNKEIRIIGKGGKPPASTEERENVTCIKR